MILPHLSMLIVILTLSFFLVRIFTYCKVIFINLSIASEPLMQASLDTKECNNVLLIADNEYQSTIKYIMVPLVIALINVVTIWGLSFADIPITQLHIIISVILTTGVITKILNLNTYPIWLIEWTSLLISTRDDINLSIVHGRLVDIKTELDAIIKGKEISPTELNKLKYEGMILSKTAEQLAINIQSHNKH